MAELELRHLRLACAIADEPSLTRAAARLGISQPALSAALQRIERRIGGRMFERSRTGMKPTELGAYVIASARIVLADMDSLMMGARARARSTFGELRIGTGPGEIGPSLAGEITEAVDAGEVTLEVAGTAQLVTDLHNQRLDFAVLEEAAGFPLPTTSRVGTRKLVTEPAYVALPDSHPLSAKPAVALADLADEDWVAAPMREGNDQVVLSRACAAVGFSPRVRHEVQEPNTRRRLVAKGSVALVQPVARNGAGIVVRPLEGDPIFLERWFAWNPNGPYARFAGDVYRCAAVAYLEQRDRNPDYRRWWDAHPEAHRALDAALGDTGSGGDPLPLS